MEIPEPPADLYRLQVENSLGLLCVHDMSGILLSVNPAVARSLGYRIEEGVGKNLRDFLAPSVRHLFDDYLRRIQTRQTDSGLMRLVAKNGTERIWFYRNTRHERPGLPPLVLGHALDVTRRVHAEHDLAEAQKALRKAHDELADRVAERTRELEQANQELLRARQLESLGVLAGGIAHDFNNLLTVLQGNIALAKTHLAPANPAHGILEQATDACRHATWLSNQLLTFAKGGAPVKRMASVAAILKAAVDLASAASGTSVQFHIASDLWPAEVDAEQIRQALHNIVLNARQAVTEGGTVEVRAENATVAVDSQSLKAGAYVRISVEDDGDGIPREILPRIFDPYFTTKPTGSGLGLTTAHAIVARHGGHIAVDSIPGLKTRFTIHLPASPGAAPEERPDDEELHRGSGRILAMDDNEALRTLISQLLEHLGYEVECAGNGDEAIALFAQAQAANRPFRAVLLDLTVPGGTGGVAAAARIREMDPSVKLIVSSGYSEAPVLSEYPSFGFDAIVPKPWSLGALSRTLKQTLG